MTKINKFLLYFCAALALCVMYAPQPIGPIFESEFGFSKVQTSLFTASVMIPLAVSSIFYGYILEKFSIKKILILALFCLGFCQILFASFNSYFIMLNLRGIEGFFIPAVLTGIMSFIALNTPQKEISSAIGKYIGVTIIGGFAGRFLSSILSDFFSWKLFIYILGFSLILFSILLIFIQENRQTKVVKPKISDIKEVFLIKYNKFCFFVVFGVFFVFQAILNYIPFELTKILGEFSGFKISLMYVGYAFGVLISFNVRRIKIFFKTAPKAMFYGNLILILSLLLLLQENFLLIFFSMFISCIGFFIIHSLASAFVNKKAKIHKPITNGIYVSFYYCGGALGSFLPGFVYRKFGWEIFIASLMAILFFVMFCINRIKKYEKI